MERKGSGKRDKQPPLRISKMLQREKKEGGGKKEIALPDFPSFGMHPIYPACKRKGVCTCV